MSVGHPQRPLGKTITIGKADASVDGCDGGDDLIDVARLTGGGRVDCDCWGDYCVTGGDGDGADYDEELD